MGNNGLEWSGDTGMESHGETQVIFEGKIDKTWWLFIRRIREKSRWTSRFFT
jgi:hypothetical protein